jgi:hypothetical protein
MIQTAIAPATFSPNAVSWVVSVSEIWVQFTVLCSFAFGTGDSGASGGSVAGPAGLAAGRRS